MTATAVVLMSFGSAQPDGGSARRYLTEVIGHDPSAGQVESLVERLQIIGGSPLAAIAALQAARLEAELCRRHGPGRYGVHVAMRHGDPAPEAALRNIPGGDPIVLLPLSAQQSADRRRYRARFDEALAATGSRPAAVIEVGPFGEHPALVAALGRRLCAALSDADPAAPVVFTAHSLPEAMPGSDRYAAAVCATAALVAAAAGLAEARWTVAFQSRPRGSRQPWLGPAVEDVVDELAATAADAVVVAPAQFLCDHLEVLYDVDVVVRGIVERRGRRLVRPAMLNADTDLIDLCAGLVEDAVVAPVP